MMITVGLLLLSFFLEIWLAAANNAHKLFRITLALLAILTVTYSSVAIIAFFYSVPALLVGVMALYRSFNIARILKNRMHHAYLKKVSLRTAAVLFLMQVALLCVSIVILNRPEILSWIWAGLVVVEAGLVASLLLSARRHFVRSKEMKLSMKSPESGWPTVSVCIPARNETKELQECIDALLASDYPKLEILVLDDCSQIVRTPEIIRGYAHKGVRFLQGTEANDNWLAKNHAHQILSDASNGEILIFAGVDIRFDTSSIRAMVSYISDNQKNMLSIVPINKTQSRPMTLVQPMRYFYEIALPRRLFNAPPILGSCWCIKRESLINMGSFKAVSRMIIPEMHFARQQIYHDGYSFLSAGKIFGIQTVKTFQQQRDTAIRVAYPRIHRRPENVALITLAVLLFLILPVSMLYVALTQMGQYPEILVAIFTILLTYVAYRYVLIIGYGKARLQDVMAFPAAAILQTVLLHYSMYQYEFDEVVWKGRNVCIPVMHAYPKLPES